jgi:hypothetical protein
MGIEEIIADLATRLAEENNYRRINGSAGDDVIAPFFGPRFPGDQLNTFVRLFDGNDVYLRTIANSTDVVFAGAGFDRIEAGPGNDFVFGGGGGDQISGGTGHDWLFGDDGDDNILGSAGADRMFGGAGDDALFGDDVVSRFEPDFLNRISGSPDIIDGGAGHDIIAGGAGVDRLTGGDGRDRFSFDLILDNIVPTSQTSGGEVDIITDFDVVDAGGAFDPAEDDFLTVFLEAYTQVFSFLPSDFKNEAQPDFSDAFVGFVFDTTTHGLYLDQGAQAHMVVHLGDDVRALEVVSSSFAGMVFIGLE